jgi:hypothetical protein
MDLKQRTWLVVGWAEKPMTKNRNRKNQDRKEQSKNWVANFEDQFLFGFFGH